MPNILENLKYTKTHEWVLVSGNKAKVGISDFAQGEITDVVHVELPSVGQSVKKAAPAAVIESVKSAFDIYSPVSGKITASNGELEGSPELINQDPYNKGYLFEVEFLDAKELDNLLSAEEYKQII